MNIRPLRPNQPGKLPSRWNYQQNSRDFIGWVNKLGIERTFIGRVAHYFDSRFGIRYVALMFLFSLLISFFISWDLDISYSGFKEGDVAALDLRSPLSFETIDSEQTERKRTEAEEAVPPSYDYDVGLYDQLVTRVHNSFRTMRDIVEGAGGKTDEALNPISDFENGLGGIHVSIENFQWLTREKFQIRIENAIEQALQKWGSQKILDEATRFRPGVHNRISINILEHGYKGEEFVTDPTGFLDISEVRKQIGLQGPFAGLRRPDDIVQYTDFLRSLIVANLTLNKQATENKIQKAREGTPPVPLIVRKGQLIVRQGEILKPLHMTIFNELQQLKMTRHQDFVSLMMAIFFLTVLLCLRSYLTRFVTQVRVSAKDSLAMGTVVLIVLVIAKFVLFISNTALVEKFPHVPATVYTYLIPASSGAMIVGLLIPFGEVVWLFSIFLSLTLAFLVEKNFTFLAITFTSSIVAARGVYGCKKREDLYWAGIKTGLVNAALIFCITLMAGQSFGLVKHDLAWNVPAGFLSGLIASLVTLTLIPLLETVFVYTTDVKLLELSNLNHPLLRDLIVRAPGTYHHSLVVGSMCEAAAEAIGANALRAKVCAYYHDIGKTNHAQYFIENQRPGENLHDHLAPGMSKTVLVAHVKDGVDLGIKYKLGSQIIDVIEQHHGTTLISFFFHRAKETENTEMHEVGEDEYRYPGPKPQFREAALCMLADSIEAAARTLDEPTPARLQSLVHNIVQKKFLDGQLDECNINLKDINLIEEAFSRILLGIYHNRIDYPTGPKNSSKRPESTVS